MATPETSTGTTTKSGFDQFFEISARGSSLAREIRGGLATFFTMAYIVVLNPLILGSATDAFRTSACSDISACSAPGTAPDSSPPCSSRSPCC